MTIISGPNKGIGESFMDSAFSAPMDREFYAFSDGDDVWEPRKLIAAVEALRPLGSAPAVFATRMKIVDENLNFVRMSNSTSGQLGFGNALVQGAIGGATSVMNKPMFNLLRTERPRKMFVLHDGWLYMIAAGLGRIVFSEESWLLYRQHGRNTVGGRPSSKVLWRRRLERVVAKGDPYKLQARELERIFGERLDSEKRGQLSRFAHHDRSIGSRIRFLIAPPVRLHPLRAHLYYMALVATFRT